MDPLKTAPSTTVIILCGGKGSRLRGVDKPLLEIDGMAIVARISQALKGLGPILISANRHQQDYQRYGSVVPDQEPDRGPLAGIAACLQQTQTDDALVVPGDCPNYSAALATKLLRSLRGGDQDLDAVCADDGNQQQHLHLALKRSLSQPLNEHLNSGGRSVHGWLQKLRLGRVDCAEFSEGFADIDEPADLSRAHASSSESHNLNR